MNATSTTFSDYLRLMRYLYEEHVHNKDDATAEAELRRFVELKASSMEDTRDTFATLFVDGARHIATLQSCLLTMSQRNALVTEQVKDECARCTVLLAEVDRLRAQAAAVASMQSV